MRVGLTCSFGSSQLLGIQMSQEDINSMLEEVAEDESSGTQPPTHMPCKISFMANVIGTNMKLVSLFPLFIIKTTREDPKTVLTI